MGLEPRRYSGSGLLRWLAAVALGICVGAGCSSPVPDGTRGAGSPPSGPVFGDSVSTNSIGAVPLGYQCEVFSVDPPSGSGWREVERGTNRVVYAITGLKAKTFELSVSAWEEPWPIESMEDFMRFVEARHTKRFYGNGAITRSQFHPEPHHAPLEVHWDVQSRPIEGDWIVRGVGLEIRHPKRPDYFVRTMYRQVARTADLDETRSKEAEAFFRGLQLR